MNNTQEHHFKSLKSIAMKMGGDLYLSRSSSQSSTKLKSTREQDSFGKSSFYIPARLNIMIRSSPSTPHRKLKAPSALSFDVYNKSEISKAIDSASTVQNRIQIVDQILKRRKELMDAENELKLERAAPIIRRLSINYKNRMKKAQSNEGRISFKKSMFSALASNNQSPVLKSQGVDKANPLEIDSLGRNSAESSFSPFIEGTKGNNDQNRGDFIIDKTESSNQGMSPFDLTLKESRNDDISRFDLNELTKKESNSSNQTQEGQVLRLKNAKNKIAFLLRQKTKGPRGLVFGNENDQQSLQSENDSNNSAKQKIPRKRKSLAASLIIAKEKIEKDLYQFLVKHENDKNCRDIVYSGQARRSITENIESKVKEKYKTFVENKKKLSYFLPTSFIPSKQALPDVSSPMEKKSKLKGTHSFFKNNATVRQVNCDFYQTQQSYTKNQEPLPTFQDESFVSYTETQLDDLYRKTKKINNTLKLLEDKLETSDSSFQYKKIEKSKMKKIKDLYTNTKEITRITKKKLTS